MLPVILTAADPESDRSRYAVVCLATFKTVPGLIMAANCETGVCLLRDAAGTTKEHSFGPGGLRIVVAR